MSGIVLWNSSSFFLEQYIENMINFYICNMDNIDASNKEEPSNRRNKRLYDYEYDSNYIYAAFLAQYGIDLIDIEYLHWFKFKALFTSLSEECEFMKIVGYRAMDLSKIKDVKQRQEYKEKQDFYRLPSKKRKKEDDEILKILMGDGDFSKLNKN